MACGKGYEGQSNFGLSNSVMERICEKRKEDGLPALAIQWGPLADVSTLSTTFRLRKKRLDVQFSKI